MKTFAVLTRDTAPTAVPLRPANYHFGGRPRTTQLDLNPVAEGGSCVGGLVVDSCLRT